MYGSYRSSGSYGSYSAMPTASADMPRYLSDARFAFPSWPRRSSLSSDDGEKASSLFVEDDILESLCESPFDDDARSVSSAGSPMQSPMVRPQGDADFDLEREREHQHELQLQQQLEIAKRREIMRAILEEKERRQAQMLRKAAATAGRRSSSSKKSPRSKLSSMTPIAEAE